MLREILFRHFICNTQFNDPLHFLFDIPPLLGKQIKQFPFFGNIRIDCFEIFGNSGVSQKKNAQLLMEYFFDVRNRNPGIAGLAAVGRAVRMMEHVHFALAVRAMHISRQKMFCPWPGLPVFLFALFQYPVAFVPDVLADDGGAWDNHPFFHRLVLAASFGIVCPSLPFGNGVLNQVATLISLNFLPVFIRYPCSLRAFATIFLRLYFRNSSYTSL